MMKPLHSPSTMSKYTGIFIALMALLAASCGDNKETSTEDSAMETLTSEVTGIHFSNTLTESTALNIIQYLYYYNGGGGCHRRYQQRWIGGYLLHRQIQALISCTSTRAIFSLRTSPNKRVSCKTAPWSSGVVMEDVNNDGYLDIYVCKVGVGLMPQVHNLLYINQKNGIFKEMAAAMGIDFQGYSTQACFLDYDKDGDLDLYLLNHNVHSVRSYGTTAKRSERDSLAGDRFFENRLSDQEGRFVDVTEASGIFSSPLGYGLAISCADINGDGWTDIYVGNDFHENDYLYFNNGDKTFREAVGQWTDHTTQFSMGVDIADLNNDQLPDLFGTDMLPFDEGVYLKSGGEDTDQIRRIKDDLGFEPQFARNHLQLNTGRYNFIDLAQQTRTFATDWSWAVLLQDFDNDGRKDIFITNGIVKRPNDLDYINYLNSEAVASLAENDPERTRKLIEKLPSQPLRNILFRQQADLNFSSVGTSQVGAPSFSNGAAWADLDQDGRIEVVINNLNAPATILHTKSAEMAGNYVSLSLVDASGRTTNGAKVIAYTQGTTFYQEAQHVKGYQSSSSHRLHIGIGKVDRLDSLVVIWPDGTRQSLGAVNANTYQTVQKSTPTAQSSIAQYTPPAFSLLPVRHEENSFNDDEKEKLIPEKLSTEGPAVLYEDLDGDGIRDMYIGGAHTHSATLLKGKKDGTFENVAVADFTKDARYEDVSVASIDFDGDGDRDLYVTSGGSIAKELDKVLEDRIYLNNGGMEFRRIPLSLPHTNGSVVAVADMDGDGFEDIFVGARSIPGSYGLSPYSFLLKNLGGMGIDIVRKDRFGMVTDARWADIDNDQDIDLVLCGDWMPVMVLKNDGKGTLTEWQQEDAFPLRNGFWKTLALADINQDGQLDILAGNVGTNSLLQAQTEQPIRLYLGDFDENGAIDPLIFFSYFKRYIPLGGRDKLLSQLPGLKKQLVSYEDFTRVTSFETLIPEVARARLIEEKTVDELRSVVYLSNEKGYEIHPLPERAQWLTIRDFTVDRNTGKIHYTGGNKEWVAVVGNAMSARLGVLDGWDQSTATFTQSYWLPCPTNVQARHLLVLENGKGLLVTNNNYLYIVE
ncbi:MAG: VCBS repeat-containing protein [Saprospiraceae bacterium]